MQKQLYKIYGAILCLTVLISCQSKEDPCANLLNEGMPNQLGVMFVDKETGESLFKIHDIDAATIKITNAVTGEIFKSGGLMYNPERPMSYNNGIVVLGGVPESEGEHAYKIQIGDFGSAILAYTVIKKENKTDDPCSSPYYNAITDVRITDHPFNIFEYEGKVSPQLLVVEL